MAKKEVKLIDFLRKKGASAIKTLSWPFQLAAIKRSFERVADEALRAKEIMEKAVLDLEIQLVSAREDDMPAIIKKIAEERRKFDMSVKIAEDIPALKDHLFDSVVTFDDKDEDDEPTVKTSEKVAARADTKRR